MSAKITSSVSSLSALNGLFRVTGQLNKSLERLSTGSKLNRAADGAASLLVSENMRSQIRGMNVAISNTQEGLSMLNTADGALQQATEHVQRIREIALAASNGTTSTAQFAAYEDELTARLSAITAISNNAEYNNQKLLDGTLAAAAFNIQVGANSGDTLNIATAFADTDATALGLSQTTLTTTANATTLLGQADTALQNLAGFMATIGGFQNQMENQMSFLQVGIENYTAAEASIRNTDIAQETANLTRMQILQQASVSALSQANSSASVVMRLLQ